MIPRNLLISKQGFQYLVSLLGRGHSKTVLQEHLDGLITKFPFEGRGLSGEKVKELRKEEQLRGVMNLVGLFGPYENILEVGCGKGELSRRMALSPSVNVIGLDANEELIAKQQGSHNLEFEAGDAFKYHAGSETELVVSLHGCGNLTDRVIDLAVESRADVICVPCCYGSIKRREDQEGDYFLPRSASLSEVPEDFRKKFLKRNRILDGSVKEGKGTIRNLILDMHRILVNFDRLLFLREHGYDVCMTTVTDTHVSGYNHISSPHRYAIVGKAR